MKKRPGKKCIPRPRKPARPCAPALEWVSDVVGRTPRVTAIGSRRVLIENHTGVLDFSCEQVRLSTVGGALYVRGQDLSLCEVRENALIVHGRIRQVDLPPEGGAE